MSNGLIHISLRDLKNSDLSGQNILYQYMADYKYNKFLRVDNFMRPFFGI